MNLGLVQRALREIVPVSLVFGPLLAAIAALLGFALPRIANRIANPSFLPPAARQLRDSLLGIDTTSANPSDIVFALAWSHPVILILVFAHATITCTRVPAAEIERGTIDVLFALPVTRLRLFVSETAAWLMCAACVIACVYAGSFIGTRFISPNLRPDFSRLLVILINLAAMYGAVGCLALAACACSDRRGRAVILVVVLTVGSLLLNFLEPLWEPARHVAFMSILHYYRPINVLMSGAWPWRDLAILGGLALSLWTFASIVLSRRDITTT